MSDADAVSEPTEQRVRRRLRELRAERGASLADVAREAGLAPSTLSRLESGARRLGLHHLPPLARALGVTVDELLAAPARTDPRVRALPRTVDGMAVWPLTRRGPAAGTHAFKLRLPADRRTPIPRTHAGHEWLYVLAGRLRLVLGEEELVVAPGEAVELDTGTPHWLGVVDEPVELLVLLSPEGEHAHLHD